MVSLLSGPSAAVAAVDATVVALAMSSGVGPLLPCGVAAAAATEAPEEEVAAAALVLVCCCLFLRASAAAFLFMDKRLARVTWWGPLARNSLTHSILRPLLQQKDKHNSSTWRQHPNR